MKYSSLLTSAASEKWKRIGINRRSGVALPLFSIYSKNSTGIGEIPDLKFIIDWCLKTGMSIVQLLPLNELGYDFSPYNSISTFALEPAYLSLKKLRNVELKKYSVELRKLRKQFPKGREKVNYGIKKEKINLLRKIFDETDTGSIIKYKVFVEKNFHWLKYYCVYKILAGLNEGKSWTEWDFKYRYISPLVIEKILKEYSAEADFYCWIQWQLFEQLLWIKKYAGRKGVYLMGDIPFLVSRNSADVWAYKNYFKLNLSSGAPPDMYFSEGQKWGMPPYNWGNIETDNYGYIKERIKYAANFFDMFRIDHFVGLFRVWTMELKAAESGVTKGKFDPEDSSLWEDHGKKILSVMLNSSDMLPAAEDLGTVPVCSEKVLNEFGVTGINVQRWEKDPNDNFNFRIKYRINSVATVSTHDSSSLASWWNFEAGTIDEVMFIQSCEKHGITGERFEYVRNRLFETPVSGKLRWRNEISNVYILLDILKLNPHQSDEFINMYLYSFGEKNKFANYIGIRGKINEATVELMKKSLEKITASDSIFSIQLLTEYLNLDGEILKSCGRWSYRINFPGTVGDDNWRIVIPIALEKLNELGINETIKCVNIKSGRI